jgi:hypothetical protein
MTLYAPNVVWDGPTVGANVFEGREAKRGFLEDWIGTSEDYRQELEDFRDFGNGVTLGLLSRSAGYRAAKGWLRPREAVVATRTDSVIERLTSYRDIDAGIAAAERLAKERAWGMSEANVQVILRLADAISRHEPAEEDFAPLVTPDYTVQNVRTAVTDKTYRGRVGILQWRNELIDVFAEDVRIEGDVVADGVDFVVARTRIVGKGTGSGAPLTLGWWWSCINGGGQGRPAWFSTCCLPNPGRSATGG